MTHQKATQWRMLATGVWCAMVWLGLLGGITLGGVAMAGEVTYLVKPAQVKRADQTQWVVVHMGDRINQGDTLRTGMGGRLEIRVGKRRHLRIAQATEIMFVELAEQPTRFQAKVALLGGRFWGGLRRPLRVKDRERFQVSTPTATIGVKGTSFGLDYDKQTSLVQLAVLSGEVRVDPVSAVLAPPKEIAGPREVAPPEQITKAEWFRLVSQGQFLVLRPGDLPVVSPLTATQKQDPWVRFNMERDKR